MYSKEMTQQAIITILRELEGRQLSAATVSDYRFHYQELSTYIVNSDIADINEQTFLDFLAIRFEINVPDFYTKNLSHSGNRRLRPIAMLNRYLALGQIDPTNRMGKAPFTCPEGFTESYEGFLLYLEQKELKPPTIRTNRRISQCLIRYVYNEGVESVDLLSPKHILSFFSGFEGKSVKYNGTVLYVLKNYLLYIYNAGFSDTVLSECLPKLRVPRNGSIPHAWSKEELRAILDAIDREDPAGKRNYAILLLVMQTGLRAADIRRLKLEDIDWQAHKMRLVTGKTDCEIELPILEDTGWAIIDYLRNGRPKTDCHCVFVRHTAPYTPIGSTATLDSALSRYIMKAGITINKHEHHGMHTLRSSLAKNMLDAGAPLPIISQTLAHQNVNTTAIYLKIDIDGLRQCALDTDGGGEVR